MSNTLLTLDIITLKALDLFKNTNSFIKHINQQYDDQFSLGGAKGGTQIRIRLPNDYTVTNGPGLSVQDTAEQNTVLVMATQRHVDVAFTSVELTMKLDEFSELILAPMVNNLVGNVASTIMGGSQGGACNYVSNLDNSGNIISPNDRIYLSAGAALGNNSAPMSNRKVVNSLQTNANVVSSLSGLFNPSTRISQQYEEGEMYRALNFEWYEDQTIINHVTGTFTAGTVNGAGQTGSNLGMNLTVNAITGTLTLGDIITIANVNAVNRVTKASTAKARQFVVTANVASGATSIPIYPGIVAPIGGNSVQYQTVDSSPANGAAITLVAGPNITYSQNLAFAPQAITMATADLVMPKAGVVDSARHVYEGLSLRMITAYEIGTDQEATRLDILFGYQFLRPEWVCIVADNP
jgi:P22 coat protein - gene protein 5